MSRSSVGKPRGDEPAHGFFAITPVGGTTSGMTQLAWSRLTGVLWSNIESVAGSGVYDWSSLDASFATAKTYGYGLILVLKVGHPVGVVDATCQAATATAFGNPFNELVSCPLLTTYEDAWKNFVRALIRKYGFGDVPLKIQPENEAADANFWNPDIAVDGKTAAQNYVQILRLTYEAKQAEGWTGDVILSGTTLQDRVARCTNNPALAGCDAAFDTRDRTFMQEIMKYPQYFDAIDYHCFNYYYYLPADIPQAIHWLREEAEKNGYEIGLSGKKLFCLELTGSFMLFARNRNVGQFFVDYFPYSADFANAPFLEEPILIPTGSYDQIPCFFSGTYTGTATDFPPDGQTIYAVGFIGTRDGASGFDEFYWTDDYQGDGVAGGLTTWNGPVVMDTSPILLSHGIYVTWNSPIGHAANFGVGAIAHSANTAGYAKEKVIWTVWNIDTYADPKYRVWLEEQESVEYAKIVCSLAVEGVTLTIFVNFHDYFAGYGWTNPWWATHGCIRYTGGTTDAPTFVKKPLWHAFEQLHLATSGWTGCARFDFGAGTAIEGVRFTFATGDPVYVVWATLTGTSTSQYDGTETLTQTPTALALASLTGNSSVTATEIVTTLDGNNAPVVTSTTLSGAATLSVGNRPIIVQKAA